MKRILLIAGGALLLVVGAAVWFGLSRLDSLVASAIEEFGSEIAGVPVRVDSVSIQLREGRGTIYGLRAGNPEGFSAGDAFSLGEITLDIDPASITSSPFLIEELTVAAPVALYETDARGRSNFDVIRANVSRYSGGSGDSPASSDDAPADDSGQALRLTVAKLRFRDGSVTADLSAVHGKMEPQKLDLPPLALDGIGGSGGATPGELGTAVLDAFTRSVRDVGKGVAKRQARTLLEDQIGGEEGKAAGQLLDELF